MVAVVALALGGCQPSDIPVRLTFDVDSGMIDDYSMRFFLSGVSLVEADGHAVSVVLEENPWQDHGTAMIALGGQRENPVVSGRVTKGRYEAIEFMLGIPFHRNHGNPLLAEAPLNVPSMFWSWQSGYKFVRLDIANDWSFHLGSTGCLSASAVRPPVAPCRQPNAARIRLAGNAPTMGTIVIHLDSLLAGIDIGSEGNCMDAYADRKACRELLARLGMDPRTGLCVDDCRRQSVFRFAGAGVAGLGAEPP